MSHRAAKKLRQNERRATAREHQKLTLVGSWSHRRKLAWAEGHIEYVEALLSGWSSDGYRLIEQPNSQGRFELRGEMLKSLPDELPLAISDAVQCLRQSLDHIVFALSKKHTAAMTPKDEKVPQFPISDKGTQPGHSRIAFCSPAAQKDICDLAPDPARENVNEHPLWLLNETGNRDKHRKLQVVAVSSAVAEYALLASDGSDYVHIIGPQRLQIGAMSMPIVQFARSPNVESNMRVTTDVRFDKGTEVEDRVVGATLRWFHDHIRDTVFQRLKAHL